MLNLMSAVKSVLDADRAGSEKISFSNLQSEYIKAIVLLKTVDNPNVPALLKPKEPLSVVQFGEVLGVRMVGNGS